MFLLEVNEKLCWCQGAITAVNRGAAIYFYQVQIGLEICVKICVTEEKSIS